MPMSRQIIEKLFYEVGQLTGCPLVSSIEESTVLLQSGLDSLGFAILVARLEQELGYDPFVLMDTPVYPTTFGEFVEIYNRFAPRT
ncbi:MAG: acyl carrier protein [Desulfuromonadales bacterium]|nr:acyl carrier protein [Desulfuromonadales bacterium]